MLDFVLKTKLVRVKRKLRSTECIVFSLRKSKPFGYNSGNVFGMKEDACWYQQIHLALRALVSFPEFLFLEYKENNFQMGTN